MKINAPNLFPATPFPRRALPRRILLALGLLVLLLAGLAIVPSLQNGEPWAGQTAPPGKKGHGMPSQLGLFLAGRTAHAAETDGELDTVADQIYGQPDFATGTGPTEASGTNLYQPNDIFVYDLTGQIFIADTAHNRVLGWNSVNVYKSGDPADVVLGQPDFDSSDALDPPTASSMNGPTGVAVGFDGLVYVSDTGNNRVLVFFPINYSDEEFIPGESFPVFESGMKANNVLGQPDFESGTPLPTGPATLRGPMGLVTDVNDNLVVADTGNNRVLIYEWNEGSGGIGPFANWVVGQEIGKTDKETFSSNTAPDLPTQRSMNGPTGVAVGPVANELYVADMGNNRLLVFNDDPIDNLADGIIGQPDYVSKSPNNGGLSASALSNPTGLKMDAGNRLFVADTDNHRVLVFDRVTPDGVADGIFGQPDFVSNTANNGGIGAASLSSPKGIATDSLFMDIYIADGGNNRVLQYAQPLPNPTPAVGELNPGTVRAGAAGFTLNIWGTGIISDTVIEINGVVRATGSEFLGLAQVKIAASEVVTTGQITVTLRNPAPGGGVSAPFPLFIYEQTSGDDQPDSVVGQAGFTSDSGAFASVSNSAIFEPAGVVIDPVSGRLFVADNGNARVLSWPSNQAWVDGGQADLVFGAPDFTTYFYDAAPGLNLIRPTGLALDSQGNLYVADAEESLVLVYTQPFTNAMDAELIIKNLYNPLAVHLDSQDNLYIADTYNHRVLFYEKPLTSKDTTPDRVFGQPNMTSKTPNGGGAISADGLHYPSGVALDKADNLYVSDSRNNRVLVYLNPASGDTTADIIFGQMGDFTTGTANKGGISAESLSFPYGLAVDGQGSLWVADSDNHRVLRYDNPLTSDRVADSVLGQKGSLTRGQRNLDQRTSQGRSAPGQGSFDGPLAIGVAPGGGLFVVDTGNSRVLGFQGVQAVDVQKEIFLPSITR